MLTSQSDPRNKAHLFNVINVRGVIWFVGMLFCLLGVVDKFNSILSDDFVSIAELASMLPLFSISICWLCLRPSGLINLDELRFSQETQTDPRKRRDDYLLAAQSRMTELSENHIISQRYVLPFPYLCQIYHLLNLKHLETVHGFSLNNIKVVGVSSHEVTGMGGVVRFETALQSPLNALRIWRQPITEVELKLHTPYTIELSIPAYGNKRITVLFNAIPINETEHEFLVDIYSNLSWPKFFLRMLLHFAACLTIFEDLPYLQKLAQRDLSYFTKSVKESECKTMWLFSRYVDLYGAKLISTQESLA